MPLSPQPQTVLQQQAAAAPAQIPTLVMQPPVPA